MVQYKMRKMNDMYDSKCSCSLEKPTTRFIKMSPKSNEKAIS